MRLLLIATCAAMLMATPACATTSFGRNVPIGDDKDLSGCGTNPAGLSMIENPKKADMGYEIINAGNRTLNFSYSFDLSGSCAPVVQSLVVNSVGLSNGNGFVLEDGKVVATGPTFRPSFRFEQLEAASIPLLAGATFVQAESYNARRTEAGLEEWYLGLWKSDDSWRVASFKVFPDGSHSRPEPLLSSSIPVRGIAYFPAVDTPVGKVTMIQEIAPDRVRMLGFDWRHG